MLEIFTLFVMVVLLGAAVIVAAMLGALPGRTARKRTHPQAEAIQVCGSLGLLTPGVLWPIYMDNGK